jgi:hypothetical protein
MAYFESYRDRQFLIDDPDARIRHDEDLMTFKRYAEGDVLPPGAAVGSFAIIPKGTFVGINEIRIIPTGSTAISVFVLAEMRDGRTLGWTSARNLSGQFISETLGRQEPEHGANRFGPNAAWSKGEYLGQTVLVRILGRDEKIKFVSDETAEHLVQLIASAREDGVAIRLTSGFRTYAEQKHLHDGWVARRPGFNLAAAPGRSNHQNGIAFDIAVAGGRGNPTYDWLARNATEHGFLRTVASEPWHWEYRPKDAASARAAGRHGLPGIG